MAPSPRQVNNPQTPANLISSGYPSNEQEIEDCIKFAGVCGLLTCLGEGAIEQQPYYEKVNKFLGSLIS